ncbi:hypothetical protein F4815DRAFT_458957 [Daldinia loculata]|uniref:uncharacterized protein n=1 Tax=Daldinia loculata TaxID=103429 RepID=UPI0020C22517|nr:uncharacterized protein F4817DRAFT_327566 [Daldinia loculata]KAI1650362.1 hypothetical protein F4817DRAFT_327566 [Daldinia loculata]KAI2783426.1 hypothetical protein F4815DRAFT_458957 [Daldinia loculata]
MPSGTENAKQQFMSGVEKTRAAADDNSKQNSLNTQSASGGDNPKAGGSSFRSIAKGDTNSSNYVPAKGPST